jgi:MFS family permease
MTATVAARIGNRGAEAVGFGPRFVVPLALGSVLNPINSTMVAVALAPIGAAFGVGPSSTAWLVSGLYLAAAIAQPLLGRIADTLGPRRVFVAGLLIIVAAGIIGALANAIGWVLVSRVLLGIGTSAGYPAAFAMVHQQSERLGEEPPPRVLSALAIAAMVSAAVGPPLGGLLVGVFGWRAIFLANVPLALVGLALCLALLPADEPHRGGPADIDVPGVALFAAMLGALLVFVMELRAHPLFPLLAAGVVLAGLLVAWELHRDDPFVDVRMLAVNPALTATYIRYAGAFLVVYGVLYGYAQWLEDSRGMSAAAAGIVLLPMPALAAISATIGSGRSVRALLLVGTVALLIGSVALIFVHATVAIAVLALIAAIIGLPNGLNIIGNQAALYDQAPPERMGSASGLFRSAQYVGAIASASVIGLTFDGGASDAALHTLALVLTVLSAALLVGTVADRTLSKET